VKKGKGPSIFDWVLWKVSQREKRLNVRTENICCVQTTEALDSVEKERDSPAPFKGSPIY